MLTRENYITEFLKLKNLVRTFDYSIFDFNKNPLLSETSIYEYLSKINNSRYYVFAASRIVGNAEIPEVLQKAFNELGFSPSLSGGWAGIASNGETIFQATGDIDETVTAFGEKIRFVSIVKEETPFVEISMEDVLPENIVYSNLPGINLVVYDKELKRVVDNVAFDPQNGFAAAR